MVECVDRAREVAFVAEGDTPGGYSVGFAVVIGAAVGGHHGLAAGVVANGASDGVDVVVDVGGLNGKGVGSESKCLFCVALGSVLWRGRGDAAVPHPVSACGLRKATGASVVRVLFLVVARVLSGAGGHSKAGRRAVGGVVAVGGDVARPSDG